MRFGSMRRLFAAGLLAVAMAAFGAGARADEEKTYGEGADGLKGLWNDVLAKATAGDEAGVSAMLEKMVMTEADFAGVFPEDKAKELAPKYTEKFSKAWPKEAKNIVAKVKERAYDEVEVVEHTASKDGSGGDKSDKKVLSTLNEGTKMYIVRIKKKGEKAGLRYDSFFYVNGAWKTGLKLTKLLGGDEKAKKDPKADPKKGGEKPADPPKEGEKKEGGEGEKKDGGDGND